MRRGWGSEMARERRLTISDESYLEPLGLARYRTRLKSAEQEQALYGLVVDFLATKDAIGEAVGSAGDGPELPFKVPGAPVHVRLSTPTKDELSSFVGIAALLLGAVSGNVVGLTIGAVLAAAARIEWLKAQYGEVCVVESVSESQPPTARDITLTLYGKTCRRPGAGCRFHQTESNTCGLGLDATSTTLGSLAERKVVKTLNAVEPIEYGIVV
jgi:hypothetical protein